MKMFIFVFLATMISAANASARCEVHIDVPNYKIQDYVSETFGRALREKGYTLKLGDFWSVSHKIGDYKIDVGSGRRPSVLTLSVVSSGKLHLNVVRDLTTGEERVVSFNREKTRYQFNEVITFSESNVDEIPNCL